MASDRPKQFLFVNQSSSPGSRSQREKELQDADRRAHAARNSSTRRRVPTTVAAGAVGFKGSPAKIRTWKKHHLHHSDDLDHGGTEVTKPSRHETLVLRTKTPRVGETSSPWSHDDQSLLSTLSLGQGNHDPFDCAAISRLPPFVDGIMDHCK